MHSLLLTSTRDNYVWHAYSFLLYLSFLLVKQTILKSRLSKMLSAMSRVDYQDMTTADMWRITATATTGSPTTT